jgi:hypothetical protein
MSMMGGSDGSDSDKIKKFPNRAARVGESAGFRRRAPSTDSENPEQVPNDAMAFLEVAEDLKHEIETTILSRRELGIRQDEVDKEKFAFLRAHPDSRVSNLETILEQSMRATDVTRSKEELIKYLAAALAYLELQRRPE